MPHSAHESPHSPSEAPQRPKGILKNSTSFQNIHSDQVTPTTEHHVVDETAVTDSPVPSTDRPGLNRELSEKEIVQKNTEINAGGTHRRTSSNPSRGTLSRRQSEQSSNGMNGTNGGEESSQRLKWDEANLYLNEGQMGGKMKIDEPKTPYAKQYDPSEDEPEMAALDARELNVDELDMTRAAPAQRRRESEIPGLDLGEPEMEPMVRREGEAERNVVLDPGDGMDEGHHEGEEGMTDEELVKHRRFEMMRKKHYEMKNIKSLLGHPEELDAMDEDP